MWSSRICSANIFLALVLLTGARSQENNGEFKHELPEGVELVDPKSLGLTDTDLSKFLGNVKVLGGGQVGDTKTQILTVGFEGDENINFNDFTIPGLTDGNKTALPEKDKEIADMAFQKFKEFFQDPKKGRQYDEQNKNINQAFHPQKHVEQPKHKQIPPQNNVHIQQHPPQFRIPMIQKPYTTPRTPYLQVTTHHPPHRLRAPPPPPPQRPRQFDPAAAQNQNKQQQQHIFNSQIKSQPHLEFGARIPVPPNVQNRPPNQPPPQQQQQFQHHQQGQGQHQFQRQQQQQQQQHRPNIQHQQGQRYQTLPSSVNPPQVPHHLQHQRAPPPPPPPPQAHPPHQPQIRFPQNSQASQFPPGVHAPPIHQPQFSQPQQNQPPPTVQAPPQPRPPLVQNFVVHPRPQQHPPPSNIQQQQQPQAPLLREQGRIVRNQLLQFEGSNQGPNQNSNYNGVPSKGLLPPPPPQSYQSATNQISVLSPSPQNIQSPTGTATSHVYIHHGPKSPSIQHTSFHPKFQPPTLFSKDFTPMPAQHTTTIRPNSFDVTPSMTLIPLSTNENAITDPARTRQLRLYQQQRAQAQAQQQASNTQQTHIALSQQQSSPTPPTTTPVSITTSYPEASGPSQQFDYPGSQEQSFDSGKIINNQISDNGVNNNAPFRLQTQQQQYQLHFLQQQQHQQQHQQQQPTLQPQQSHHHHLHHQHSSNQQPTVMYTQEHRRPPRQGSSPNNPPRFQFHVSHDLGHGPRFQMHPDPKGLLNTIRRKRGYRRLSNLFNRMFKWDRH